MLLVVFGAAPTRSKQVISVTDSSTKVDDRRRNTFLHLRHWWYQRFVKDYASDLGFEQLQGCK